MGCGCNEYPAVSHRCKCQGGGGTPDVKGEVKFCDLCDPCNPSASTVKLCAFVVPTLEDGRYYKNSFIFVQEDDSTYYISDDRSEIPFGSRPKFIDNFNPAENQFKNTVVYDLTSKAAYVYGPDGTYMAIPLVASAVNSLTQGEGIILTDTDGDYTIAIDPERVADASTLATAVENITALQTGKQDALTAGDNITIEDNVISATDTTYERMGAATASTPGTMGLVPAPGAGDNTKFLSGDGVWKTVSTYALPTASPTELGGIKIGDNLSIDINGVASATDTTYSDFVGTDGVDPGTAGLVPAPTASDTGKYLKSDGTWDTVVSGPVITMTTTDPGEGAALADNNFIAVYES